MLPIWIFDWLIVLLQARNDIHVNLLNIIFVVITHFQTINFEQSGSQQIDNYKKICFLNKGLMHIEF